MEPVAISEDDFERRRELRRQKREEMRLEAERMGYGRNEDDDEEAARERRRRARQERLRNRENEEAAATATETTEVNSTHSVSVTETITPAAPPSEDDQALLDRLAKREERRQRRMREALERQKELDPTVSVDDANNAGVALNSTQEDERREGERRGRHRGNEEEQEEERDSGGRRGRYRGNDEEQEEQDGGGRRGRYRGNEEEQKEEVSLPEEPTAEPEEEQAPPEEEVEEKPRRSYLREQEVVEEKTRKSFRKEEVFEKKAKEVTPSKQQNGMAYDSKHKKPERTPSRGSGMRSPEAQGEDQEEAAARLEAERKLEELKRRRDDAESEEFEKMRQKQQEAEAELEELRKKREERRKILEEEEKQRKQEREEKKAKEEEEKRRMKEEIERRRAEAAEKRQKEESGEGEDKKPFKCVSPRGSSLKIGERAEFLNKSAQKSSVKATHVPMVSKIDNRLEQYTTALQSSKDAKSPKSGASDLPLGTDGVRNIKSMWEKGNVFSSPGGPGNSNKEAAGMKIGVAGRINDWLNKTPEPGKPASGKPADLKPGDVTNKRSLWENKGSSPTKQVAVGGKSKAVTNAGTGH
ncbi:hypothetical protein GJAV_G00164530 [Gymnothorax javanicus]|nr:hypothetical protein GJAV_G00164530 [Gymnothorax javanicus]